MIMWRHQKLSELFVHTNFCHCIQKCTLGLYHYHVQHMAHSPPLLSQDPVLNKLTIAIQLATILATHIP